MAGFPWLEFATLMVAFGIGAVSPGPDFAMVLRQSVIHGRGTALVTSAGIGAAILVHGAYTVLGIGLVVAQSVALFTALKIAGATYLVWLGIGALRAAAPVPPQGIAAAGRRGMAWPRAFAVGFLTNLLNPKVVLFFVALFATAVSATTPAAVLASYVAAMALLLFAWFALVSVFLTAPPVRAGFFRLGRWFNRLTGVALILLALRVAVTRQT